MPCTLHALVPDVSHALHAVVLLHVFHAQRALVAYVPCALRASYLTCLTLLLSYMLSCLTCLEH